MNKIRIEHISFYMNIEACRKLYNSTMKNIKIHTKTTIVINRKKSHVKGSRQMRITYDRMAIITNKQDRGHINRYD